MNPLPTLLERNYEKYKELKPEVQWAAVAAQNECDQLNLLYRVIEVYRTQNRQDQLFAQGRTKQGPVVTWTRNSAHTRRLAMDIAPLNCTYKDLEQIMNKYGIHRPKELVRAGDLGHFSFEAVGAPPQPKPIDPQARLKGLKRRLETTKLESSKELLRNLIRRLEERLKAAGTKK